MQTDLAQDSNILRFQQDFEILSLEKRDAFKDAWRVFGTEAERPLEELPRKTSVQRGFADFLILGGEDRERVRCLSLGQRRTDCLKQWQSIFSFEEYW